MQITIAFYVFNLGSVGSEKETLLRRWLFALLLPSVLSTVRPFANSPVRCKNAATMHILKKVCLVLLQG